MQETESYLGILRERGRRGLPIERVYRNLFNRELYLKAYGRIYRNKGAMTHGINEETADGMSLEKIDTIIDALRHERYRWKPARRVWIPKKNGKQRPLGVTTWSDKLVAEAVRLILDAYFDVQWSLHSHGFREGRGCGDALREIYHTKDQAVLGSSKEISLIASGRSRMISSSLGSVRKSTMDALSDWSNNCWMLVTWKTGGSTKP